MIWSAVRLRGRKSHLRKLIACSSDSDFCRATTLCLLFAGRACRGSIQQRLALLHNAKAPHPPRESAPGGSREQSSGMKVQGIMRWMDDLVDVFAARRMPDTTMDRLYPHPRQFCPKRSCNRVRLTRAMMPWSPCSHAGAVGPNIYERAIVLAINEEDSENGHLETSKGLLSEAGGPSPLGMLLRLVKHPENWYRSLFHARDEMRKERTERKEKLKYHT